MSILSAPLTVTSLFSVTPLLELVMETESVDVQAPVIDTRPPAESVADCEVIDV